MLSSCEPTNLHNIKPPEEQSSNGSNNQHYAEVVHLLHKHL